MSDDSSMELSRRKILAGLGSIGVASAGVGLGTSAYFSDEETFTNNRLVAGSLDMKVSWDEHYSDWSEDEAEFASMPGPEEEPDLSLPAPPGGKPIELVFSDRDGFMDATRQERFPDGGLGDADPCEALADVPDDLEAPVIDLDDVKPGDFGEVTFDFSLCDNPGYVWMTGELLENAENGYTEPERKDPDESGEPNDIVLDNGIYEVTVGEYDSGSAGGSETNNTGATDDDWYYSFSGTAGGDVDPGAPDTVDTLFWEFYAIQDGDGNVASSSDSGPVITSLPASGTPGTEYTGVADFDLGGTTVRISRTVMLRPDEPVVEITYEFENRSSTDTVTDFQWTQYIDYDIASPSGEVGNYVRDDAQGLEYITQNEQNVVGDNDLYVGFTAGQLSASHDLDFYSNTANRVIDGDALNDDDQYPDSGGSDVGMALRYDLGDLAPGGTATLETAFVTAESESDFEDRLQQEGPNTSPTADAGPNQTVDEQVTVDLDGTGSSDPDGDALTYSWTQTGGQQVTLSGANSATPSFTAPDIASTTTVTFELTVEDGRGGTDTDSVTITVQPEASPNTPPTADAGPDRTVDEQVAVDLDGTGSSDPDGDALTYAWTQTGGPQATLSDPTGATPSFTAPDVSSATTVTFELTVEDGRGGTDTDSVAITVEPVQEPVTGQGELAQALRARAWYDDGDNVRQDDEEVFVEGSLGEVLTALSNGNGVPLDGDQGEDFDEIGGDPTADTRGCYTAADDVHYVGFQWWLPIDHGNEVQTDSVSFDLGFYTEQCRHNDGEGMARTASVTFEDQESDGTSVVVDSATLPGGGFVVIHESRDGSPGPVLGHSAYLPPGTSTDVTVQLDSPISESQELIAMAHADDGDGQYEFPDADGPYTVNGSPVIDAALIDVLTNGA